MPIGNPITLTSNVSSKTITTTATSGQTNFTIPGGYRINQISVFRNGVKLASDDYQAMDGSTVILTVAATLGDTLEFQIFDDFRVATALDVNTGGSIGGNISVNGSVTATSFVGNVTGSSTYATTSGISTTSQGLTGTPNITVGVTTTTTLQVGSGSSIVVVDNMGELGIGTASPITKFDLFGASTQSIVSIAASNIDCSLGNYFTDTINGNKTYTVSNVPSNRAYSFTLEVNNTSGTITWFSGVEWPGGTAPTLTTGKTHLFMFVTDNAGSRWRASSLVNYTT